MAAPTIRDSTATNPGGTGTTITVTLPTHAVDDVIYIVIGNTGNTLWAGNPAGWDRVDQRTVGTSTTGIVGTVFRRRVLSGDSLPLANPVFTLGATVTRAAFAWAIDGADLEGVFTLPEWGARGYTTGTANPVRPPTVVTPAPETLVLHHYFSRTGTNAPDPSTYTQDEEIVISGTLTGNASSKTVADQQTSLANQDASPASGVRWVAGIICIPSPDYPYYRSGTSATTASGTSVTPALPSGTTATDVNGRKDVLIITVEGAGVTTLSMTDGAWTEITGFTGTTSGNGSSVKKFWAYMSGTLNRQANRTGTGEISALITTFHNCHQTNPIGAVNARQNASSTTSTFDALTRTYTKVVMQATCVADNTTGFTSPATWSERMDGMGISCSDQPFNAIASTASASFTLSTASATRTGLLEIRGVSSVGSSPSPSVSPSASTSPSASVSPSSSVSPSASVSPSVSPSSSASPSVSPSSSVSPSGAEPPIVGSVTWGHETGVVEDNIRTFTTNWTGTGAIENSGDAERLALDAGEFMESEVVETGTLTVELLQGHYQSADTVAIRFRHGSTQENCEAATWEDYTAPFDSLGFVQVRVEATI